MKLKKEQPSSNVVTNQSVNRKGLGPREDRAGKDDRLYQSPQFRRAIEDVSSEFQSRTRTDGKRSREDAPMRPENMVDMIKKYMKIGKKK
jgi:hypothetical protein